MRTSGSRTGSRPRSPSMSSLPCRSACTGRSTARSDARFRRLRTRSSAPRLAGGWAWELAAAGLPAVLVPGAFATGNHQEKNARWFADAGGAVVVAEKEAARAPQVVEELLAEPDRLAAMAVAMRAVAKPDAAEEIADELVSLAAARR